MKTILIILTTGIFITCDYSEKSKYENCDYINEFINTGNTKINPIKIGKRIIDPIDDTLNFTKTKFNFASNNDKIYKKARTYRRCGDKRIDVEYFQDFTNRIDLNSYREINDTFFTTKNTVYFWWVNSDGHLIIPINNADAETSQPFDNICGGIDKKAVYYGCPNHGVSQLNIPVNSKVEFISQEDNYWNSPKHQIVIDGKIYDMKWDINGYFYE